MATKVTRIGRRFGRLIVLERLHEAYRCVCDCGKEVIVKANNLGWGTNSCGCLKLEMLRARGMDKRKLRFNQICLYYRRNSKVRGHNWELSKDEMEVAMTKPCHYCGIVGSLGFDFNGLDRIDNSLGYTKANITACCKRCNQARNDMTQEEFYSWISKVYKYQKGGDA